MQTARQPDKQRDRYKQTHRDRDRPEQGQEETSEMVREGGTDNLLTKDRITETETKTKDTTST